MRLRRWALSLAVLPALSGAFSSETIPRPETVLGAPLGTDGELPDWSQLVAYLERLAAASPRLSLQRVGQTTEGRPFLLLTISSEANLRRLEGIRRDHQRLADPRGLDEAEAARLLERGRMVVALLHGIHSTEVAGPLSAVELAWQLSLTSDPELLQVLDEAVLLLVPSQNPDGTQKVAEWYRSTVGTPFEASGCESACRLPFLYHHYVGHDNNRDWYAFTQQETRLVLDHVFRPWHPPLVHDVHQMSPRSVRLFVPPYLDPWEPNVDPALRAASSALGTHIAATLTAQGRKGVAVHGLYDAWTPSRAYSFTHAGVRLLSETAGTRLASPLELTREQLEPGSGVDPRVASWNLPAPWTGGTWRLRDAMDYQLDATRALLVHAARHRRQWLRTFLDVNRRASSRREPYAFLVPPGQADPLTAWRMLHTLHSGEVELHRARAGFEAEGRRYPSGTTVVLMAQPASAFAKTVLERQRYPELRVAEGLPRRPYDTTAHTLPLLMGVQTETVAQPFAAELEKLEKPSPPPTRVERGSGRWLTVPHTTGGLIALSRLLRAGVPVRWAMEGFSQGRASFPAGTLLVPASARARLLALGSGLGLDVQAVRGLPPSALVRAPRVGLYASWVPSMDEGWTRFVFEKQMEVPYTTLRDADIQAGNLRRGYDAIVIPDQSPLVLLAGNPEGSLPPPYTGGLGRAGVAALRAFVEQGGTLVTLDAASRFAIEELQLPVSDALWPWTRPGRRPLPEAPAEQGAAEFYGPGSLLEAHVTGDDPLVHGVGPAAAVWFESSPAFTLLPASSSVPVRPPRVLLRYPAVNPLLSGWLIGPEKLHGLGALVEAPLGQGRVVLFGFRPQFRGQSWATYPLLLNALYLSALEPAPLR